MEKKEIPCCLWVPFPLSGTCKCGAMGNEGDGELEDMDADSRFLLTYIVVLVPFPLWPLVPT